MRSSYLSDNLARHAGWYTRFTPGNCAGAAGIPSSDSGLRLTTGGQCRKCRNIYHPRCTCSCHGTCDQYRGSVSGVDGRSEERRVGKECRARGGPGHEKKKKREEEVRVTQTDSEEQWVDASHGAKP